MALPVAAALPCNTNPATTFTGFQVKQERPEDAEINALAAKMVEQNKAKMAAAANAAAAVVNQQNRAGTGGILSFLTKAGKSLPDSVEVTENEKPPLDASSQKGKFGWVSLGGEHIPYILRADEKYCSVRMVELKLLGKYLSYLSSDIYSCTCIRSYYITESEAKLLSEINSRHCDFRYGRDPFSTKDLVVLLDDANEFYQFLDLCYKKLNDPMSDAKNRCGFVRINKDSVVPYTVKDSCRFVPLFYFEGETDALKKKSATLGPWDLAYLKFCCKVQGIRSELFAHDSCQVISLADIKAYFPPGTLFDEYWPTKVVDSQLLVQKNSGARTQSSSWIKAPPGPVVPQTTPVPNESVVAPHIPNQVAANGWSLMSQQQRYPSVPNRLRPQVHNPPSTLPSRYETNRLQPNMTPWPPSHTSQQSVIPPLVQRGNNMQHVRNSPSLGSPAYPTSAMNRGGAMTPNNAIPMLSPGMVSAQQQYVQQYAAQNSSQGQKFPPPLLRVNGSQRYYQTPADVIDLSSPPHSPQNQRQMSVLLPQKNNAQVQYRGNETVNWDKLIPITETPSLDAAGGNIPFKLQKALVGGKMVPCINAKPYVYSELLLTVNDLMDEFFPTVSLVKCREVLQNVLHVNLFSGNLQQKLVLRDNNKCKTLNEVCPLIQLKDVLQYMPQLRYVMESNAGNAEPAMKRQRVS